MKASVLSKIAGSLLVISACVFALPAQAALNPGQANAIVLLLVSFGADDATIAAVWRALGGSAGAASIHSGSLSFVEVARPDNTSVLPGATAVPFTAFALTNNTNALATIYSVTVEQTGRGKDSNIQDVMLVGSGSASSTPQPLNGSQVDLDSGLTLLPGQSITLTVVATIAPKAKAGQLQLEVVAINASVPIKGDLPISGSTHAVKRSR